MRRGGAKIVPVLEVSAFADGQVLDVPGRPRVIHAPAERGSIYRSTIFLARLASSAGREVKGGQRMLVLTEAAAQVVKSVTAALKADAAGLRIASAVPEPVSPGALQVTTVPGPDENDQVINVGGARVYLEPQAAAFLEDKVLDGQLDAQGNAQSSLSVQGNGRAYRRAAVSPVTGKTGWGNADDRAFGISRLEREAAATLDDVLRAHPH
jgi:iron-sulfur cluster assembly protein